MTTQDRKKLLEIANSLEEFYILLNNNTPYNPEVSYLTRYAQIIRAIAQKP